MELQERLKQLETVRDWQGLVEELEKGIQSSNANEAKASYHLRLGQELEGKFLSGVKALKHFRARSPGPDRLPTHRCRRYSTR